MKQILPSMLLVFIAGGAPLLAADGAAPPSAAALVDLPGSLGIVPADVAAADVRALGLKEEAGAIVREVATDGPAARAGIRPGDVVMGYAGIAVLSAAQFRRLVRETPPGRTVELTVVRDGKPGPVRVTLSEPLFRIDRVRGGGRALIGRTQEGREIRLMVEGEGGEAPQDSAREAQEQAGAVPNGPAMVGEGSGGPAVAREPKKPATGDATAWVDGNLPTGDYIIRMDELGRPRLGVTVEPLSGQLARYFGLANRTGVLVTSVAERSPAATAGFLAGDVILAVGETPVPDAAALRLLLGMVETGELVVKVMRDKKEIALSPRLGPEPEQIIIHRNNASPLRGGDKKIVIRIDESQGTSI